MCIYLSYMYVCGLLQIKENYYYVFHNIRFFLLFSTTVVFFLCSSSACCYVLSNISNNFCEKLFNEYLNYVSYNISTICDREQRKSFIRKSIIRDWFYFFSKAEKFLCERFILSLTFKVFHSRSLIIINTWLYNFAKVAIFWYLGLHEYFLFVFWIPSPTKRNQIT